MKCIDEFSTLTSFPLSAHQIEARHTFLETLLGKVKPEETESLETVRTLVITITTCRVLLHLPPSPNATVTFVDILICSGILCFSTHVFLAPLLF